MKKINNDIKEDYCSFEVSKLLKEKGFDIKCKTFFNAGSGYKIQNDDILRCGSDDDIVERPTIQMAIEWIRVNFGIWIFLDNASEYKKFNGFIIPFDYSGDSSIFPKGYRLSEKFDSPKEAFNSALIYTLNNL